MNCKQRIEKRESMHLTQEQFANGVGVSVRTVQSWEQEKRGRNPDRRSKIALEMIYHIYDY